MKINHAGIEKVANGFIVKIYSYEHSEDNAKQIFVFTKLDDALDFAKKVLEAD